jgi:hypothetical protein
MAIFASTTLGSSDPSRALSIKALEARAQALAAAQSKQEMPTSLPSPWQGASLVTNQLADAFATKRADQAAAQRRQDLAGYMSQVGPEGPTPQLQGQITAADPDIGKMYAQQAFEARQSAATRQAQKEAAAEAAKTAEAAAVAQETRVAGRPKTDIAQINADAAAGRMTEDERAAAIKKLTAGSPAEQKAINEQEDKNIDLQSTVAGLKEARALLDHPDGVYSGAGASAKEFLGRNLPGVGEYLGTDKATTERTNRYNQIVNAQALDLLSQLKGASSDRDMNWAISILNDKGSSLENKKRALDVLVVKVEAHRQASEQRLKAMGREPVKVETPAPAGGAPAAPAAASGGVQSVATEAEAMALPPGTRFKLPDGRTGTAR